MAAKSTSSSVIGDPLHSAETEMHACASWLGVGLGLGLGLGVGLGVD